MDKVFIYWDNSNIFVEAQRFAEERNSGPDARYRVRIDFTNMLRLAADRPVEKAHAAGSVPPEMRQLWNRLESQGVDGPAIRPRHRRSRRAGDARPDPSAAYARRRSGLQRRPRHSRVADRGWGRLRGRRWLSPNSGADAQVAAGGWRSCRGPIPAINECAAGPRRMARLSPSTTSTTPSRSWSRPVPATVWRSPAIRRRWTCRAVPPPDRSHSAPLRAGSCYGVRGRTWKFRQLTRSGRRRLA